MVEIDTTDNESAETVVPPFTSQIAHQVLGQACRHAGLEPGDARLVRLGENAVFRCGPAGAVIVRIARGVSRLEVARRELCVARWLHRNGVPTINVYEEVTGQPIVVGTHPVTFWRAAETGTGSARPTVTDLAHLLRDLHQLFSSPCELPPLDPLSTVRQRLAKGLNLPASDLQFLTQRCQAVGQAVARLEPRLAAGPVHGDAHTGNLLGRAGAALWSDFETFAVGMREWDLVPVAVAQARLNLDPRRMDAFAQTYGFDIRHWDGFRVLREARELGMTTWLAQNVDESKAIADEVSLRLQSLRTGDTNQTWTAF